MQVESSYSEFSYLYLSTRPSEKKTPHRTGTCRVEGMATTFSSFLSIYLLREAGYFSLKNLRVEEGFEAWQSSSVWLSTASQKSGKFRLRTAKHKHVPGPCMRIWSRSLTWGSPLGMCHTGPAYQHAPDAPPGLQPWLADRNLHLSPEVPCLILPPPPALGRVWVHAHHGPIHHHRQWPEAPLSPGSHPAQTPRPEPYLPSLRFSPTWAWFGISSEVLVCYPAAPHQS